MRAATRLITFAVDVDNTLLDNDGLLGAMDHELLASFRPETVSRFWTLYEGARVELGVASPFAAADRLGLELGEDLHRRIVAVVAAIEPHRFLYPRTLDVLGHLRTLGAILILSEGDPAYQRAKIERAGITRLVDDVLVFPRKDEHILEVVDGWPALLHVFVDDKVPFLEKVGRRLPEAYLIHVRQGKYARRTGMEPKVDLVAETIGDLGGLRSEDLLGRQQGSAAR